MPKPATTDPHTVGLQVDIVSDVMCPWCYIGKRRLEQALSLSPVPLDVRWRPFQLDPTLPVEGKDRRTYLAEKFGSEERAAAFYQNINNAGVAEGIAFRFDKIAMSPNTLDAHRLIRWAGGVGSDTQDKVVEGLFAAYFLDGRHIGDRQVLREISEQADMDGSLVAELLETDADRESVRREIALAAQMGVTGVPTFIIADRFALIGAQPAENLVDEFSRIAQALSVTHPPDNLGR